MSITDFANVDLKTKVKNVPDYAWTNPVWVIRFCEDGNFWFFGAWPTEDIEKAARVANEINGIVVTGN